jgi:APA family basic amino acid/polyamine antiporter
VAVTEPKGAQEPGEVSIAGNVFLRKSSGVIRAMSPRDAMFFGYLSAAGLYGVSLYLFLGGATFPGANVWLSIIFCGIIFGFIFMVYGVLGSAMPRSGGDYVFTSRLLSPVIGFTLAFAGWAFWQFFYSFLAASTVVTAVLQPFFSTVGAVFKNDSAVQIASWLDGTGPRLGITIGLLILSGYMMINGLSWYLKLQNYFMIPSTILAILIVAFQYIFVSHNTFIGNFNSFEKSVHGLSSQSIITQAAKLGYPGPGFSWADTWGLTVMLSGIFLWCMWQTELLGEMKTAKNFRNVVGGMQGANVMLVITFIIGIAWTNSYVGARLMGSFSYLATKHPDVLGGGWAFRGAPALLTIPTLNGVLILLIFLGFLGPISQSLFNTTLTASRLYLSMSFDRTLPARLGNVNRKGAPATAVVVSVVISIALAVVYTIRPNLAAALFVASVASLVAMLGTVIAGTVFPYRRPDIYNSSPAAKYRVGKVPMVTVVGGIASAFLLAIILSFILNPAFGLLTNAAAVGWVMMAILFIGSPIYFYGVSWYRKRQGILLAYAFAEVPPE